jgi:multicomponent Na+:H+ antiporter subunit D
MDIDSTLPGWSLLPAAVATVLIVASGRRPALRDTCSVLAALGQTALVLTLLPGALAGTPLVWRPLDLAPGVPLALRGDALGVSFAAVASALWVLTTVYSIGYVRAAHEHAQTRYFASFALCLFATVGLALAENLLTFVCFFEMLTVAAYPLVVHRGTPAAARAGRIYLAYTLTGGVGLLVAVAATYVLVGHVDFTPGGILADTGAAPATLWALFVAFALGCGVKAAVVPLHTWLPVAMIAPTPVSALLHAVAVVKAGVFGFVRVTGFVFGTDLLQELGLGVALAGAAAVTILFGALAAVGQDNLKRLLAFSTVSQLSYIMLGASLGTTEAVTGGVLHITSHAVLKITLFFCAGAIYVTEHRERVSELDGIGRRMPLTMAAFALAAVLLAGLPPGIAFSSKWRLLTGAAEAGLWPAMAVLLASTVLSIAYFAPVVVRAYARGNGGAVAEAPPAILVPLLVTAGAGLLLGLAGGGPLLDLARATAAAFQRTP